MVFLFLLFCKKRIVSSYQIFIFRIIVIYYMSRFTLFDFMISSVIDDDHIPLKILCYYRTFIPLFCIFYDTSYIYSLSIFHISSILHIPYSSILSSYSIFSYSLILLIHSSILLYTIIFLVLYHHLYFIHIL